MGTGEGAQAYGWGTYVTDVEGIGRTYATTMRDKLISDKHKENAIINKLAKKTLESNNGDKEEALNYLRSLLDEDWSDKKRVKAQIKIIETGRFLPETKVKAQLYSVDIPDDNRTNYIHWETNTQELADKLNDAYRTMLIKEKGIKEEDINPDFTPFSKGVSGNTIYNLFARELGGQKQASQFLNSLGFAGISYPAQATTGGRADGARNFVIFNEEDARIVEHTRFRLTQEEQDIISQAQANGTYLKAPNGKDTHLTPEQWARVRTKAFKEWFGDWEKTTRIEKLKVSEPINVEFNQEYELNRDRAKQWALENLRKEYSIADTGERIELSKVGAKKVTSHSAGNEAHLKSIVAIPQMIENAIFIEETVNEKSNNKYDKYRYYVVGLNIDGVEYTARLTIGVKKGKFYYDHNLTEIEKGNLIEIANGFTTMGDAPIPSYADIKDKRLLSLLQTNSSKIVDENGEPMVMYHGDRKKGRYIFSTDTFFTPSKDYAKRYTNENGYIYDTYLDIRKPFDVRNKKAYDIFTQFNGGRKPVETTSGALDWSQYTYEDLQEYLNENYTGEYDGFILDEGGEYDGNGNVIHRGLSYIPFSPTQIKSATDNVGTYDSNNPDIRFRTNDIFISNAENAVLNIKQSKATSEQWIAMLKNNGGLKAGEDKWLGLEDWLKAQKGSVTKQEVLDYIAKNEIQVEEVGYNDNSVEEEEQRTINPIRLDYTTPGLERNREIALTVPTIESWNASDEIHFGDAGEGRAIAWIRFGETTDSDGNATLVIDEIQSKRHQEGREKGYFDNREYKREEARLENTLEDLIESKSSLVKELNKKYDKWTKLEEWKEFGMLNQRLVPDPDILSNEEYNEVLSITKQIKEVREELKQHQNRKNIFLIPDAPFDKNWHELAMKRMLRLAAEEGYNKIAWTTGEQQADRYDMSREIESIQSEDETITEASDGTPIAKALTIRTASGMDTRMDVDANGI